MLSVCGCGLSEKDDRSIRFAVLKYEQIRVTVKSTAGKLMVEISAPGFDVIACGFGTGPNGSDAIDQVVGIPNGGNKTFVFPADATTREIVFRDWDKYNNDIIYPIWRRKGRAES